MFFNSMLPSAEVGVTPRFRSGLIVGTLSITWKICAPAPLATPNTSIKVDDIPKLAEPIMTPKNTLKSEMNRYCFSYVYRKINFLRLSSSNGKPEQFNL